MASARSESVWTAGTLCSARHIEESLRTCVREGFRRHLPFSISSIVTHQYLLEDDRYVMTSAKGEDVGLRVWFGKRDFYSAVNDFTGLTYKLVHASPVEHPVSLLVDVDASGSAWRLAVDGHPERDRF